MSDINKPRCIMLCPLFLCFFLLGLSKDLQAEHSGDVKYVSIIALIGNPGEYDGKTVQVEGYVHLEFEGSALYLHEEDYKRRLSFNSIYLYVTRTSVPNIGTVNDSYCTIQGTFHQARGGIRSGVLDNITRFANNGL